MKYLAISLIMTLGLGGGVANAEELSSSLLLQQDSSIASDKIASRDWSAAEEELISTDFGPEDQIFAKVNLAFLYSATGRADKAQALYQEILDGRDNSFAMTLSGQPRKVKYIAKDGIKRLDSL
jgi:hypothetical protein|tara:strand:+ start:58387 stop:58758 length:372 start_codon:yes stop_codon:yes gene_type:complete